MSWLDKRRGTAEHGTMAAAAHIFSAAATPGTPRACSTLKDFLWLVSDVEHGRLLDLGPVWQSTVSFFTGRGFKVYTEDLLLSWKKFLEQEERRLHEARRARERPQSAEEFSPAALAERFLGANLLHPAESFDAVLAWDALDYLDGEMVLRLAERLYALLRPNGVVLALFHSRKPEGFHRYRIVDPQTIQLVSAPPPVPLQHTLQNREVLNLFSRYRSSKTLVGRDQLREGLFRK